MKIIGVIGGSLVSEKIYETARRVGNLIAERGYPVLSGGLGGVMEAVSKGAKEKNGLVIGVLPGNSKSEANPYIDIPIVTGMGEMRNVIIVKSSDVLIAVDGSYGTMTEIAFALKFGKKVIGLECDDLPFEEIEKASSPEEAVEKAIVALRDGG